MQKILDYASSKMGFVEGHVSGYPELVVGAAPGLPNVIGWVFRLQVSFTVAVGQSDEIVQCFQRMPLRALESEALRSFPVDAGWRVCKLVVRSYPNSTLKRVVALGEDGQASILFEGLEVTPDLLLSLQQAAVDRSLREVVGSISSVAGQSAQSGR